MALSKEYQAEQVETGLQARWQSQGIFQFDPQARGKVYSVDTPPPTVSGNLHLGHVYSYSQTDFMARFFRMRGYQVFYPMGFDDNGLPTERLVEKRYGITAAHVGRKAFIEKCLEISTEIEQEYQALWKRLGLSVDWRYSYRSIDAESRKIAQLSFLELYRKGLIYRQEAPTLWCPECQTAIAQAELNDLEREGEMVTLAFQGEGENILRIATTRPELLPACTAVFVHPDDERFRGWTGKEVVVPLIGRRVPVLADERANPTKGAGAVMCCTFGDTVDVEWWYIHHLPLFNAIGRDGRMTGQAGKYSGLETKDARKAIKADLEVAGLLLERQPTAQSVRVHERCDTPVEFIVTRQWFVRVLDHRPDFLAAGEQIQWRPAHMRVRYREWVENLHWDWCISRQRFFGVPFPLWYCADCGEIRLAEESQLPVDPLEQQPPLERCSCGSTRFLPETDVMDTWATSSLSPQIVGRWLAEPALYQRVYPFALRPQAHEIIRTWAFYTIVKSWYHFGAIPWKTIAVSGWGLAPQGMGKISKSRGGGPAAPAEMIRRYSADALRYWAAGGGFGKDMLINEEKMQAGLRLATKLWNVARFSERFLAGFTPDPAALACASPADRWILSRLQGLVERVTGLFEEYEYAAAKNEAEQFFWNDLADNYLEMAKQRLYAEEDPQRDGARLALHQCLLALVKLFAPVLPHITEAVYLGLFASQEGRPSVHVSAWPEPTPSWRDLRAEQAGELLVQAASAVRRFKSEHNLPLGSELDRVQLCLESSEPVDLLRQADADLKSITRARQIEILPARAEGLEITPPGSSLRVYIVQ